MYNYAKSTLKYYCVVPGKHKKSIEGGWLHGERGSTILTQRATQDAKLAAIRPNGLASSVCL